MRDVLTEEECSQLRSAPGTFAQMLQAAARLGAERERERAARVCEQWAEQHRIDAKERHDENCDFRIAATDCAAAIRRGEDQ